MHEKMTIYEVAQTLGVSAGTIYRWTNEGVLPAPQREGGRVFWNRGRLMEWAEQAYPGREFDTANRRFA